MQQFLTIESESITLRPFTRNDFQALYALTRQREITDILPDWNMTEEQLTGFLGFVIASYDNFSPEDVRILLAMEHKQDRKLIGWCGVFPNDKLPSEQREVAYAISKDYRSRGYTSEAVIAIVDSMFRHTQLSEIVAIVKPFNIPSRKVVEKAGFRHVELRTLADGAEYDYFTKRK